MAGPERTAIRTNLRKGMAAVEGTLGVFAVYVLLVKAWLLDVMVLQLGKQRLQLHVESMRLATQVDNVFGPFFAVEVKRILWARRTLGNNLKLFLLQESDTKPFQKVRRRIARF